MTHVEERRNPPGERPVWTVRQREDYRALLARRAELEEVAERQHVAQESGVWQPVQVPGLRGEIDVKKIAATVTAVVTVLGGGWWGFEKVRPAAASSSVPATVSEDWKHGVDEWMDKGRRVGYPTLEGVVKDVSGLKSEVSDMSRAMARLESRVVSMTLVLLNRDLWQARQARDRDEVLRIQRQIDELEREMRGAR